MKPKLYLILSIQILLLVSCTENKTIPLCADQLPEGLRNDANTVLQISFPHNLNTLKINDDTYIVVDNTSQDIVYVAPDVDLKFYLLKENKWSLLENQLDFLSATGQIIPKTDTDPGGMSYTGRFRLQENQSTVQRCVTVEGVKDSNGVQSKVAAFAEVTLRP
jgi:hypothetical protein